MTISLKKLPVFKTRQMKMKKNSLEIIPKQVDRITNLPKNLFGDVYIAYIPGESLLI